MSMASVYSLLETSKLTNYVKYYISEKSIKFDDLPQEVTHLNVWLIPTFDSLEDQDEVYIPSGKDIDFFEIIRSILSGTAPAKLQNR
jgi:hypothetical protein